MAHFVICKYCNTRFDRDKEEYVVVGNRRYGHASCMLREAEKDPNFQKLEIIDPNDKVACIYCKQEMSKKDDDCVLVSNGKYAHKACQEIENKREKTDQEKLELYIKELFNINYIEPRVKKQIKQYVDEYNYSYSGIMKTLKYFYEIKGNDIAKAHGGIGIVPHVYQNALNYYYQLWEMQEKNKNVQIELYIPKVKEVVIPRPQRKVRKREKFAFLDEEEN